MERLVTVEFGPSRSRRFGRALAEARSRAGECSEVEPGRHRVSFRLDTIAAAYTGLARLLEGSATGVQPRCTRGTSRSQPSRSGRWPGAPPPSSSRLGAADSASTPGFFPAARSAPCSMPSGRSGRAKTRRRRWCLRSPSAPTVASHLARTAHPSSTSAGKFPTSHHENGNSQPVNNHQANAASSSAWPSRHRDAGRGITKALELSGSMTKAA